MKLLQKNNCRRKSKKHFQRCLLSFAVPLNVPHVLLWFRWAQPFFFCLFYLLNVGHSKRVIHPLSVHWSQKLLARLVASKCCATLQQVAESWTRFSLFTRGRVVGFWLILHIMCLLILDIPVKKNINYTSYNLHLQLFFFSRTSQFVFQRFIHQ